jgi:putative RNA 2'-phosphotransferase
MGFSEAGFGETEDEIMAGKKNVTLGKFISKILRHEPGLIGIRVDEHGWADVEELIAGIQAAGHPEFDMAALEEIVETNNKQRYSFSSDKRLIRANQGHSIPVDVELEEKNPPDLLWHGTGEKYVPSIDARGLIPKGRLYVHLSSDRETARKVGSRHGKPVIYEIDCRKMKEDGYRFFLSANHIWLTKEVPAKYLKKTSSPDHC